MIWTFKKCNKKMGSPCLLTASSKRKLKFVCFSRHQCDTLVFLRSEKRDAGGSACFGAQVSSKPYGAWHSERVFCNLCALALWLALHIFATLCWRGPRRPKQLSTDAILLYRFLQGLLVLVMLVSRNVFRVVSALQSIVLKWGIFTGCALKVRITFIRK